MKLLYFESENFGDALNPFIFNYFFPDFFDDDPTEVFIGIGSVLGFIKPFPETKKAIVFSSGYAYDDVPVLDERYDVRCVRGPGTAHLLGLKEPQVATDGALLLRAMPHFNDSPAKKFKYSFIPHYLSLTFFGDWESLLKDSEIEFINPLWEFSLIIEKIRQSEIVFAESLHGAIVADTFRVPWVPVIMYGHINKFKWQDWYDSINLGIYEPVKLSRLFNKGWRRKNIAHATKLGIDNPIVSFMASIYRWFHTFFQRSRSRNEFNRLKRVKARLSNEEVLDSKLEQLLRIINEIKVEYGTNTNRDA